MSWVQQAEAMAEGAVVAQQLCVTRGNQVQTHARAPVHMHVSVEQALPGIIT